jgi:hypothetical protein
MAVVRHLDVDGAVPQSPVGRTTGEPSVDEKQALFDALADRLSERLLSLAHHRLSAQRNQQWLDPFPSAGGIPRECAPASSPTRRTRPRRRAPAPRPPRSRTNFLHQAIELVQTTAADARR